MSQPELAQANKQTLQWEWLLLALGSHTAWGIYPVLARYLQVVSGLPGLAMLSAGNAIGLLVVGMLVWRRGQLASLGSPILWLVALLAMLRSVTNVLATRYTLAIYVQLITLLTPFLVVALGIAWFRTPIPHATGRALMLTLVGALLVFSGDLTAQAWLALAQSDWVGIGLASFSALMLALYMFAVRATSGHPVSGEATFAVQMVVLSGSSLVLSLLAGEDWQHWSTLGTGDWLVFGCFTIVILGANMSQIGALRRLGAPFVSSLQAWRLVATLVVSALILNEWLTTLWQLAGALLVIATISWYLWQQRPVSR